MPATEQVSPKKQKEYERFVCAPFLAALSDGRRASLV